MKPFILRIRNGEKILFCWPFCIIRDRSPYTLYFHQHLSTVSLSSHSVHPDVERCLDRELWILPGSRFCVKVPLLNNEIARILHITGEIEL